MLSTSEKLIILNRLQLLSAKKKRGSPQALEYADQNIIIPMQGMVQSLNVSVAAALILFEAQRQRDSAGLYNRNMLSEEIKHPMYFEGCHPIIARQCKQKTYLTLLLMKTAKLLLMNSFGRR